MLLIGLGITAFINGLDPAWIALIGTLFGGIGLKILEHWLGKSESRKNSNRELRRDLNDELQELIARVDRLEDEVTLWRDRYYAEQEKVAVLRIQVIQMGGVPADRISIDLHSDENPIEG